MEFYTKEYKIGESTFIWMSLDNKHWWPCLSTQEMEEDMEDIKKQIEEQDAEDEWGASWSPEK